MSEITTRSIKVRLVGPGRVVATDTHKGAKLSLLEIKRLARDFLVACYVREHCARSFGGEEYSDDNMRRAAAATRDREIQVGDRIETEAQWHGLLHSVAALSGRDELAVPVRFTAPDRPPTDRIGSRCEAARKEAWYQAGRRRLSRDLGDDVIDISS